MLPPGLGGPEGGYPIGKGADIFIATWNLHRQGIMPAYVCALQSVGRPPGLRAALSGLRAVSSNWFACQAIMFR